jgi:hypothetical protein
MKHVFNLPRGRVVALAGALTAAMSPFSPVTAASGDAWLEFQQDVERSCLEHALPVLDVKDIFVDPFGSESYGYAVMIGTGVGSTTGYMMVCTYDKLSQTSEVSGLFDL